MSVEWVEGSNEIDTHLEERSKGISAEAIISLESALQMVFQETQTLVHVISGRLRASGRTESDIHENIWSGEIVYGSEIADYAWFEERRGLQNGRDHNFMAPARDTPLIGIAFYKGLED